MTNDTYHPMLERLLLSAYELDTGSFGLDAQTLRSARQRFLAALDEDPRPFLDLLLFTNELRKLAESNQQARIEPLTSQLQMLLALCGSQVPAPTAQVSQPASPAALISNGLTPRGALRSISLRGSRLRQNARS